VAPIAEPLIIEIDNGWDFSYIEEHEFYPTIQIRNLTRSRSGDLIGELDAFCQVKDKMIPVSGIRFNLTSLQTRGTIAKALKRNYLDTSATWIDWDILISDVCLRVLKLYRNGTSAEEIWPSETVILPQFLIKPILPLHQPAIIFGDGGAGKGHIAIMLSILAQLPYVDNPLGLIASDQSTNVLYLDYESDRDEFERTLSGLCKGMGQSVGIKRLQMAHKLSGAIEQIKKRVVEDSIGLLVVDSLAPASGGNIAEAEPAIELYTALRTLPSVTTLIIAHNSKDLEKRKSVYGSVFFTNLARSVWEVKKSQEEGSTEMLISMSHRKANRKLELPIGLSFQFNEEENIISISKTNLAGTSLSNQLPNSVRIFELLREGPRAAQSMAEILDITVAVATTTLNRLKDKGNITHLPDKTWGLQARR